MGPEDISKLHEEVSQMPVVPSFCYTAFSLPALKEKEKTQAWSADGSLHNMPNNGQTLSRISLKDRGERKYFQWVEP